MFRQCRLPAAHFHYFVVLGAFSFGHEVVGEVGDGVKQFCALLFSGSHGLFKFGAFGFESAHLGFGRLCFLALSLLHQSADGLGQLLLLGQSGVHVRLRSFTLLVGCQHGFNGLARTCEMFLFKSAYHGFLIVCDLFDCQHLNCSYLFCLAKLVIYFKKHALKG